MSNNLLRILTALVGIPAVLGLTYLGGWAFLALVAVMALLAQYETYHLLRAAGLSPHIPLGLALGALVLLYQMVPAALPAAIALFVLAVALSPFARDEAAQAAARTAARDVGREAAPAAGGGGGAVEAGRSAEKVAGGGGGAVEAGKSAAKATDSGGAAAVHDGGPGSMAATLFGVVYPTALLAFLVAIRGGGSVAGGGASSAEALNGAPALVQPALTDGDAFALTVSILVLVWTTDSMAYFVGRAIGRRPLAPRISPKKTWEGTLGGAAFAVAAGALLKLTLLQFLTWPHMVALALICGVLGQLGDLAESKMKRAVGVKDSGALLPGHGGMLDRFDSMIVVAPAAYLYLRYVAGVLG